MEREAVSSDELSAHDITKSKNKLKTTKSFVNDEILICFLNFFMPHIHQNMGFKTKSLFGFNLIFQTGSDFVGLMRLTPR